MMMFPNAKASRIRKGGGGNGLVAVAIDEDKGSQEALKWAAESLLSRGQTVILIHVLRKSSPATSDRGCESVTYRMGNLSTSPQRHQLDKTTKDLLLTFHCFCTRKDIKCLDVLLEDTDVVKAVIEFVSYSAIENLVLGTTSKHGFMRFKTSNIPSGVSKRAPDFCTVYVISRGKISSVRNASRPAPFVSPLISKMQSLNNQIESQYEVPSTSGHSHLQDKTHIKPHSWQDESIRSAYGRGREGLSGRSYVDYADSESDISFISSGRPSSVRPSSVLYDHLDATPRISVGSNLSFASTPSAFKPVDPTSLEEEVETDMRRLKLELKQTMDMYSVACREALTAQHKLMELSNWRREEEKKLEEARLAQEAALAIAEKEKARCKAAMETAEAAKKIAAVESHKRASVEMKALREAEGVRKLQDNLTQSDGRYRKYSIEEIEEATEYFSESRKIGEGGYGPVFRCYLDHTPAAVKVLRPDASQGRAQFQQEVDILSRIRHPNMVLLLGACPEYGVLIYEYMANGSLEDCLLRKRNHDRVLPWQYRFRIAAEIATGLLFLHQTKPEPLVHRDLKPANILLDHNYVSKISDVGLARLVPAVAENVTQCWMTAAAGTFCYIDPEYQQTGMLGVKSDVYSLGIMLLQLVTGKPPMGLAHIVEEALNNGTFEDMLDPSVPDWPVEQALCFTKLALKCAELRRKDRPDLGKVILPELTRLREFADEHPSGFLLGGIACAGPSPSHSQASIPQDVTRDPRLGHSGESSRSPRPHRFSQTDRQVP